MNLNKVNSLKLKEYKIRVHTSVEDVENTFETLWEDLQEDVALYNFMTYMLNSYVGHTPVGRARGTGRRMGSGRRRGG